MFEHKRSSYSGLSFVYIALAVLVTVLLLPLLLLFSDDMISADEIQNAMVTTTFDRTKDVVTVEVEAVQNTENNTTSSPASNVTYTASVDGAESYERPLPYNLTRRDIGGYSLGGHEGAMDARTIDATFAEYHISNREGDMDFLRNGLHGVHTWYPEMYNYVTSNMEYNSDGMLTIHGRYLLAIGEYFFNTPDAFAPFAVTSYGELFDIVLQDGTVIPCVYYDSKGTNHCNNNDQSYYTKSPLIMDEYKSIYQAYAGEIFEWFARDNTCVGAHDRKWGLSNNVNPAVKVVMYNKWIDGTSR